MPRLRLELYAPILAIALALATAATAAERARVVDPLSVDMALAVDRDCDGALDDEAEADRAFDMEKSVGAGECVVFEIAFRNDGAADLTAVAVREAPPEGIEVRIGGAVYHQTPHGLTPRPVKIIDGEIRWTYEGRLAPGARGAVRYDARLPR